MDSRLMADDFDSADLSDGLLLRLADVFVEQQPDGDEGDGDKPGHDPQGAVEPEPLQQHGTEEEADAFQCVLRAGERGDKAEQSAVAGHELHGTL